MKIQDLWFQAHLDDGQLLIDSNKSGLKAGQALGQKMSTSIASSLKTVAFSAIAVGAAIAGKGLLELNGIQADFQAETGATAAEAEAAGKAINDMGGHNLQPLKEIGLALTKVHTDMGLTGQAAVDLTEKFLKYATATKQDASGAVVSFDHVLDAWGLTAADATTLMDKLIASHEKYGGSIEKNQADLAALAPQLIALNLSLDDGIGLLNLFEVSGLDASVATRALNTAVAKLKPGQGLNDLIAQISSIADPTLRAQEAVRIFGARGGVALANVLKPGITSLKDFEISTTDAAGATEKAAGVIEDSWGNRVKLAIKGAGAAIIGFGQTIGPLGSAITGLVSIAGALGPKLGPVLAKGIASAWAIAAGSSILGGAIGIASDKAATLYLRALIAGDALSAAVGGAWTKVIGSEVVSGAIAKAGAVAFAAYAGAVEAAALAAPILIPALLVFGAKQVVDSLPGEHDLGVALDKGMDNLRIRLGQKAADTGTATARTLVDSTVTGIQTEAPKAIPKAGDTMVAAWKAQQPKVTKAMGDILSVEAIMPGWTAKATAMGNRDAQALADGIRAKRDVVNTAWQALLDAIHNGQKPAAERAQLVGELVSSKLAWGLHSGDPAVRDQARATQQAIIDRLAVLGANASNIGKKGMQALHDAMHSKNPLIKAEAHLAYLAITQPLAGVPAKAKTYGQNAGQSFADGIESKEHAVEQAASKLAAALGKYIKISSPAEKGPLSTLGGPEGWGKRIADYFTRGLERNLPDLSMALGGGLRLPAFAAPSLAAALPSMAMASPFTSAAAIRPASVAASGGDTYQIHLLDKLEVRSVRDIGSGLRMLGEQGHLARKARV
jgi:hypothetical protein